ncbi:MAG: heavy-metal-associated domain-containing protein [Planctomycetota bacterium]
MFRITMLSVLLTVGLVAGCATHAATKSGLADCAGCGEGATCTACAAGDHCPACRANPGPNEPACAMCVSGRACTSCAAAEPSAPEPVATIEASGMGCPLCAGSADRRLKKVDGVAWTRIDLGTGTVTVGLDPDRPTPDAATLRDAVRDAGFTPGDVTLPARAEEGAATP